MFLSLDIIDKSDIGGIECMGGRGGGVEHTGDRADHTEARTIILEDLLEPVCL